MRYLYIFSMLLTLVMTACTNYNQSSNSQGKFGEYAKQAFLEKRRILTEREALSKEIDWYQEPQITDYSYLGEMSGKDIISICNRIKEENEQSLEELRQHKTWCAFTYNVEDIKEYALDHPNEVIASKYHLAATFTTYSKDQPYSTYSNDVIVIRGINKIILLSDTQYFVTFGVSDFSPKWYE